MTEPFLDRPGDGPGDRPSRFGAALDRHLARKSGRPGGNPTARPTVPVVEKLDPRRACDLGGQSDEFNPDFLGLTSPGRENGEAVGHRLVIDRAGEGLRSRLEPACGSMKPAARRLGASSLRGDRVRSMLPEFGHDSVLGGRGGCWRAEACFVEGQGPSTNGEVLPSLCEPRSLFTKWPGWGLRESARSGNMPPRRPSQNAGAPIRPPFATTPPD